MSKKEDFEAYKKGLEKQAQEAQLGANEVVADDDWRQLLRAEAGHMGAEKEAESEQEKMLEYVEEAEARLEFLQDNFIVSQQEIKSRGGTFNKANYSYLLFGFNAIGDAIRERKNAIKNGNIPSNVASEKVINNLLIILEKELKERPLSQK